MEKNIIIDDIKTIYLIDNFGRVRNEYTNTYYKPFLKNGYRAITIPFRGENRFFYIHELVAQYFVKNPLKAPLIRHKDGDPLNNRDWNLEWYFPEEEKNRKVGKTSYTFEEDPCDTKPLLIDENVIDLKELHSFRDSHYYVSKEGQIFNMKQKRVLRLIKEKNGKLQIKLLGPFAYCNSFLAKNIIWEVFNGPVPKGKVVKCIDGNEQNVALNNLKLIDRIEAYRGTQIYAIKLDNGERIDFRSLSSARKQLNAHPDSIKKSIKNHTPYKGYYWYLKE